jgi:TfoX/Sxy family transcriptional regulator of competence genes
MLIFEVEVRTTQAYSNEPRKVWRTADTELQVKAKNIEEAIKKAKAHALKDFGGQFVDDETGKTIKYWSVDTTVIRAQLNIEVDVL